MSTLDSTQPRKRLTTYGKAAHRGTSTNARPQAVRQTSSAPNRPEPPKAQPSIFDVPSSDEETSVRLELRKQKSVGSSAVKSQPPNEAPLRTKAGASHDRSVDQTTRKRKRSGPSTVTGSVRGTGAQREEKRPSPSISSIATGEKGRNHDRKSQRLTPTRTLAHSPQSCSTAKPIPRRAKQTQKTTTQASIDLRATPPPPDLQVTPISSPINSTARQDPASSDEEPESTRMDVSRPHKAGFGGNTVVRSPTRIFSTTPRQNRLWDELLDNIPRDSSPSSLKLGQLDVGHTRPAPMSKVSQSDLGLSSTRRHIRLVDRLRRTETDPDMQIDPDISEQGDLLPQQSNARHISDPIKRLDDAQRPVPPAAPRLQTLESGSAMGGASAASGASQTSVGVSAPRITYARQRSYLEDDMLGSPFLPDIPLEVDGGLQHRRQDSSMKSAEEELEISGNGLRSIHELRAAGSNTRFMNDIETLLDDLEGDGDSSISRKRSAMIELCTKLDERGFVGRFLDNGFERRLVAQCAKITDVVLGTATCIAIGLVVTGGASASALQWIWQSGVCTLLTSLLQMDQDVVRIGKERRTNMSKSALVTLRDFQETIKKGPLFPVWKPSVLSPQVVSLRILELLVRKLRENGHVEELLDGKATTKLTRMMKRNASPGVTGSSKHLDDLPRSELVLSIMESASLTPVASRNHATWSTETLAELAELLPVYLDNGKQHEVQAEMLALRVCLNLTNNNPRVCDIFASPLLIRQLLRSIEARFQALVNYVDNDMTASGIDLLILSLGAMINLAEYSDSTRLMTFENDSLLSALIIVFTDGAERAHKVRRYRFCV